MTKNLVRKITFCLTAALALTSASCGHNRIYPVSGKVMLNGAPAAGAAVFFYRQGADRMNEHMIMGVVQEDGSFELVCGSLGKGAPPGEYDVLIEWRQRSNHAKGATNKAPDRFRGRYADLKRPRLHAVLKAQTNLLPPFELTD
jgi:hypothetical protein